MLCRVVLLLVASLATRSANGEPRFEPGGPAKFQVKDLVNALRATEG